MIRFLTIWFVLCTWLAPVTEHAQAQDIKKLLFGLIVSAYTFDSLKDGIQVPITVSADHNNGWWSNRKGAYTYLFKPLNKMDIFSLTVKSLKNTGIHDVFSFK